MYHYNFTNDLRISSLDEILQEAANAFLTDTVPSASDDKSKNNNFMTVGFYFNLKAKGNCAKLASNGNTKKVVLNFIKKFQFPNLRTSTDYENSVNDKILLAPMRDIVKLLHIFSLMNSEISFLTKEEIKNFIFYNDELAKRTNYNLLNTANQILKYRKDNKLPSNIDTNEKDHSWNQPERQIREMIKTLNYTGCFLEDENGIRLKDKGMTRDNEADLFEIINCNSYWKGESLEEYQKYMDDIQILEDEKMGKAKNITKIIDKPHNRIVFGAPGTGKSHKLNKESRIFKNENTTEPQNEIEKLKIDFSNINADENFVPQCVALGYVYSKLLLDKKNEEINELLKSYNPPKNTGYYLKTGAQTVEFFNYDETKDYGYDYDKILDLIKTEYLKIDSSKNKVPQMYAIGLKYSDAISSVIGKNAQSLINNYLELEPERIEGYYFVTGSQTSQFIKRLKENTNRNIIRNTVERVTFHPNYSYAQFVGTYKPVQDATDENQITYKYVPGPFMRVYTAAKKNPKQDFLLLIEEINRANVAAVFGDVFQLLDRYGTIGDENGNHAFESEYPIAASEDIKKYLARHGIDESELSLPHNMYIWATMNSADQGVFPMDTAFKRRWEFEYIRINENEKQVESYKIPICKDGVVSQKVNWNELRKAINDKLISLGVNEDKLLGPFFLSKSALENAQDKGMDFVKLFESKVLMYLFEDAAKMKVRQLFNLENDRYIYSEVCKKFENNGLEVFSFCDGKSVAVNDIKENPKPSEESSDDASEDELF